MSEKAPVSRYKKLNILGSIRAKYIAAFALLISIVVLLLAVIISSAIMNFVLNTRHKAVDGSASLVADIVTEIEGFTYQDFDGALENYPEKIGGAVENVATTNGIAVVVTDRIGNVKFSSIPEELDSGKTLYLSPEVMRKLSHESTSGSLRMSNLHGFYSQTAVNGATAIRDGDGNVDGIVLASAPTSPVIDFMHGLIQTLVMSFLWITIAAVVVAAFICERIVSPLRIMEKAAKGVTVGSYDIKVPEDGVDNEIADLASAFNEMSREVKEKEITQRSFLGSVSHDMRTPMTSIAGFVDGILDGTIPPEKQEYYLRIVSAETHRLSRLVSTLLDLTRIQSGERKFTKADFDICELLRLILISMEKQIDEKHLEIEFDPCDDKCMVFADSDGIHQVAYNLIHNAIKFTDEGGTIKIGVKKHEGGKYLISIYNTGKGMKKEELPYIFDRFFKSDPSRGLDKSGVGLGLFIVKTILSSHSESIWAESEEGQYSQFNFTLQRGK
ncbi:MAG: HAMP domain-containing histidine kinase [Clostridia bacterium]|nr:HAMP domain-containing histidine kinase [Clostridia bacterium]